MADASSDESRFNIIGPSGSGKSTLGRELARPLELPYIQLDQVYWEPNWNEPSDETFFARLKTSLDQAGDRWVVDGNYTRIIPIKWKSVHTVIWLDYPLSLIFPRALSRALRRIATKQELWPGTGNRETFRKTFLSRDSILLWTLTSYRPLRKRYAKLCTDPQYSHIKFVRLTQQLDTDRFLDDLST